jgi:Ca-activated chloride channel family protein
MRFADPSWLWGLLMIPVLFGFILFDEKGRKKQFGRFAQPKLWRLIAPEIDWSARIRKAAVLFSAFAFLLLALARPQFGTHEESVQVAGLDIMIALDVSNSMETEDVAPSRLQKAKHLVRTLVKNLGGDRVGLVAFAGSTYVACPLTTDLDYVLNTLQILNPRTIQNQGTTVIGGLETAYKALERGAEESLGPTDENSPPTRVILLISDGEDHESESISFASKLKSQGTRVFVLGVGTEKGGPIPLRDGGQEGFKKDRSGKTVISTFRPDFLSKVASAAGGKYWTVTPSESEVSEILQDIGGLNRSDYTERRYLVYEERFQIPLAIAVILFLLELSLPSRKILACFGYGLFFLMSSTVYAENSLKNPAPLDTYLENKKGIQAYKEGRLEEALKSFGAAQARDPSRPELEFNQGVVEMQRGDVDQAIESFQNSYRASLDKKNLGLQGKSLYNLGNAQAKKGDVQNSIRSYLGSIDAAQQTQDAELEARARKNLQLLMEEQQQKQKQDQKDQKDQKEKKDPSDQNSGSQNQNQSGKEDSKENQRKENQLKENQKDKDGKDKQPPHYQETKKGSQQQFKSKKMDPQDAERVLSELKGRERNLQEKLQNQNARTQNSLKDW